MIFSRWRPDTGGYDYFDSPSTRYGLGDDLPVPRLPRTSDIGSASTEIGRVLPMDAVPAGSGPLARGMIIAMDKTGLKGLGMDFLSPGVQLGAAVLVGLGLGFVIGKARK